MRLYAKMKNNKIKQDKRWIYFFSLLPIIYLFLIIFRIKNIKTSLIMKSFEQINLINEYSNMSLKEIIDYSKIVPFNLTDYLIYNISFNLI